LFFGRDETVKLLAEVFEGKDLLPDPFRRRKRKVESGHDAAIPSKVIVCPKGHHLHVCARPQVFHDTQLVQFVFPFDILKSKVTRVQILLSVEHHLRPQTDREVFESLLVVIDRLID